jgi:hypothetical protein
MTDSELIKRGIWQYENYYGTAGAGPVT